MSAATHYKGFDQFGWSPSISAPSRWSRRWRTANSTCTTCPRTRRRPHSRMTWRRWTPTTRCILSDIGSNTLLLHPDVWLHGTTVPNRLKLIRDWVASGRRPDDDRRLFLVPGHRRRGALAQTPVEHALPVTCLAVRRPDRDAGRASPPTWSSPSIRCWGPWRRMAAAARRQRGRAQDRGRRAAGARCPTRRAVTRCWSPAPMAGDARSPGPRISARTGCPRVLSWEGYARLWKNLLGWLTEAR